MRRTAAAQLRVTMPTPMRRWQCLQEFCHTGDEAAALGRFDFDVLDELGLLEKVLAAVGVLLL